jgi:hydrogenase expression/formation protein HypC
MCVGIPGQIIEIVDPVHRIANVDVSGRQRKVNLALLTPEEGDVGDWVLIHAGLAVQRLDEAEAHDTLDFLAALAQLNSEEEELP